MNANDSQRVHPYLVDGGIYDNQGIHKLIQDNSSFECDIVLVSDAGAGTGWKSNQKNALSLLIRVTDIFMLRTKNMQMIAGVFDNTGNALRQRQIGYFSLSMDPDKTVPFFITMFKKHQLTKETIMAHHLEGRENDPDELLIHLVKASIQWDAMSDLMPTKAELKIARNVSTNLMPLKEKQSAALIKHSYVMTLIFMRLYCTPVLKVM
jgi:NTE family protein